ncbi:polyprenol monophosphomannose synthase [Paraburkholderia tropica]|uniref:polyprenol monophosphomannose synthase n=1 Tax=Paraburkholderia tropica TaxID=92647 RepID=UPI002AB7CCD0|nr:polyprenol monophosphomannose synthase [Paraburkholderia tropica]
MKITILIPTYNESGNIANLLGLLKEAANECPSAQFDVVILDDSSPDGTAHIAEKRGGELAGGNFSTAIWSRAEKDGLGKAYIFGFKRILNSASRSDYVLQMDADLSHDPKYIGRFIEAARNGADFVTATRYVGGGGTPDWPWYRKCLSIGGNWYARQVLGQRISDYTGGFNMYGINLLSQINFDKLFSAGYGFLIDLKFQAINKSKEIAEIPIIFRDRTHGNSKMPARTIFDSLILVLKIKVKSITHHSK